MNIPYRPILSSLLRNRTGALLVSLQIAIALAVLVNAVYIVKQRIDHIGRPTGMDVENIFVVSATGFAKQIDTNAMINEDIAYLRGVPGVTGVTPSNAIPISGGGSSNYVTNTPDDQKGSRTLVNYFEFNESGLEALGVKLIAGRWFTRNEVQPQPQGFFDQYTGPIVVSQEFAEQRFPNENALGKTVYTGKSEPLTIIGITDRMIGSWTTPGMPTAIMFIPRHPAGSFVRYLVRTSPGMRDAIMSKVEAELGPRNRGRAINYVRSLELYKERSYLSDRNMGIFLVVVTTLLLAITSLGIFGLATFNVSTRTKQVGTRRAVGARRSDIIGYFLVENWMITTAGVVIGCLMALGVGQWLALEYQLPRVDLYYLIAGVLALWVIGLAAAWQPARRAAKISPALATRTV
jgi:putative ABC transport system permease protein